MIIQILKQNDHDEIRIESAESLDDARKNKFFEGEYSRFFINGRPVRNYMSVVRHIIDSTIKYQQAFLVNKQDMINKRKELLDRQISDLKAKLKEVSDQYKESPPVLKAIDDYLKVIDDYGVRVKE
jgi:hypothetical protein